MDRKFFDVLFERVESGYVGLCQHPKKGTRFVPVHQVAESVNGDFYFSVGVFETPPASGRGTEADVSLLPCLWIDIDFADKTDAKKDYPTEEQARKALDQMPAMATLIVNSGGGLHAYWVLTEPKPPQEVKRVCRGWQKLYGRKIAPQVIDSTADAARILRIPGTINTKHNAEVVCTDMGTSLVHDLDFLEQFMPQDVEPERPLIDKASIPMVVPADVDAEALMTLLSNSPEFDRSWHHKKAMASCSEYELSIATYAAYAGWTDGQIAGLILIHRRRWEPDKEAKARRPDYLRATIARARAGVVDDIDAAVDHFEQHAALKLIDEQTDPAEARKRRLRAWSDRLGVEVIAITQTGSEQATSTVAMTVADGREIAIGPTNNLLRPDSLRKMLLVSFGIVMSEEKSMANWENFLRLVWPAIQVVEEEETTEAAEIRIHLEHYLATQYSQWGSDYDAIVAGQPIERDGQREFTLAAFSSWIRKQHGIKVSSSKLSGILKVIGYSPTNRNARQDGQQKCRSYWKSQK